MLNLHRDKKVGRCERGRDGKIFSDHRQDGNDEVYRLYVRLKRKKEKKVLSHSRTQRVLTCLNGAIIRRWFHFVQCVLSSPISYYGDSMSSVIRKVMLVKMTW